MSILRAQIRQRPDPHHAIMLKRIFRFAPVTVVMGAIFFLSHQPGTALHLPPIPFLDKILHGIIYGILAASAMFAVSRERIRNRPVSTACGVILFCLLYGMSDEYHQAFIPGRIASLADLAADTVGAAMATPLVLRYLGGDGRRTIADLTR